MSPELRTCLGILVLTILLCILIRRLVVSYPKSYRRIKRVVLILNLINAITVLVWVYCTSRYGYAYHTNTPLMAMLSFQVSLIFARLLTLD